MRNMTNFTESEKVFLTTENSVFTCYILCVNLLILKMIGTALLTVLQRFRNKVFISPEDTKFFNGEVGSSDVVDRVRRAHQNDLENIPIFCLAAFTYIFTDPPCWLGITLISLFTGVRILHTVVYAIIVVPQPTRATLWTIGVIITAFMCLRTALFAFLLLA